MTATFQDYCLAKQGHELFQARDEMAPTRRSVNPVSIANDRSLEIQLIEALLFGPRHDGAWSVGTTHLKRHAQANDGPKSIRSEQSAAPSDRRSPIMSDNDCLIRADRVDQSDHVSGQMQ